MKVAQINCVYDYGSTGKITKDIHRGLQSRGIESVVLYGRRQRTHENSVYKTCTEFEAKAWHVLSRITGQPYAVAPCGTQSLIRRLKREQPDAVHLQCINGFFVNIYTLLKYLKNNNIPTVLTLHAEFMYTGGCGHSIDCNQWSTHTGCGHSICPKSKTELRSWRGDQSAHNWQLMKNAFEGFERIKVCAVSDWVKERAENAPILNGKPVLTVLNGIETSVFNYCEQEALKMRERLNVGDRKLILHVTAAYDNPIKGGNYITELSKQLDPNKYLVVVVDGNDGEAPDGFCGVYYGRTKTQHELAALYSAADVMVITSERECLPTTCLEALCCGTKIACFRFHGDSNTFDFPDKYVHYSTFGRVRELKDNIELIANDEKEHKEEISLNCCRVFASDVMVENYLRIYQGIV